MADRRSGLRPLKTVLPRKPIPKTSAERSAAYRQRLKEEDPGKWEEFLNRQKLMSAAWRHQRSGEKKLEDREKATLRKQASRLRLKEKEKVEGQDKPVATVSKPRTRAEFNAQVTARAKLRDLQQKSRANMSTKKKQARYAKRMADYYLKKEEARDQKLNLIAWSKLNERRSSYLMRLKTAYKKLAKKRDVLSLTKLVAIKDILTNSKESKSAQKLYKRLPVVDEKVADFYNEQSIDLPGKCTVCRYSMQPKKVLTRKVADLFDDFKCGIQT